MQDISKYFKYSIITQVAVVILVTITLISYLEDKKYSFVKGSISSNNEGIFYVSDLEKTEYFWPTPEFTRISSYFGNRVSPTKGASTYHKGIDILAYQGSRVCSIAEGTVLFSGFDKSGGYMVKIQHANNLTSSYCHLSEKIPVRKGDMVLKGEVVGTVGPKYLSNGKLNGATTGVHLHFAIAKNNTYIDPLTLLKR